jgi:hypothetical protein
VRRRSALIHHVASTFGLSSCVSMFGRITPSMTDRDPRRQRDS